MSQYVPTELKVNMCLTSTGTIRLIRDGEKGGRGYGDGRRGRPDPLHCHHQNYSSIKMGSDESHFNVSLIVMDKVTRQYPHTQLLKRKESRSGFEPMPLCLPA